jgi:spore coat protein A
VRGRIDDSVPSPRPSPRRVPPLVRRLALATGVAAGLAWTAAPLLAATPAPTVATAGAPLTGAVVAIPGGASTGYATKVVVVTQGSSLSFVNLDELSHTVTSVLRDKHGNPLFSTSAAPTSAAAVAGVRNLPAGQYSFYCQFHPNMTGTLVVASLTGGGGGAPTGAAPTFPQRLRIPPVLTGSHITIPVHEADVRVMPDGPKTLMWTYGGTYPGPTIRRPAGHPTTVTFVNHLPQATGNPTAHSSHPARGARTNIR